MTTTSISLPETKFVRLLLERADDALILGHRLSEWCGHAPLLEEELALANIALDLIGQARALYAIAGEETGFDEDQLAYLRDEGQYRNLLLLEQPNGDFAFTIVRQLLYSTFIDAWWRATVSASDARLAAVAEKAVKESAYHVRHAGEWLVRLGDGTAESHAHAQAALDQAWRFTGEMFAPDLQAFRPEWDAAIDAILARATLTRPSDTIGMRTGGRAGRHSEHLGRLLTELQYLQRVHPGASW
jgi:ring-1,2-phenylacetyl-CoA epoxidase subunit PaaC